MAQSFLCFLRVVHAAHRHRQRRRRDVRLCVRSNQGLQPPWRIHAPRSVVPLQRAASVAARTYGETVAQVKDAVRALVVGGRNRHIRVGRRLVEQAAAIARLGFLAGSGPALCRAARSRARIQGSLRLRSGLCAWFIGQFEHAEFVSLCAHSMQQRPSVRRRWMRTGIREACCAPAMWRAYVVRQRGGRVPGIREWACDKHNHDGDEAQDQNCGDASKKRGTPSPVHAQQVCSRLARKTGLAG